MLLIEYPYWERVPEKYRYFELETVENEKAIKVLNKYAVLELLPIPVMASCMGLSRLIVE